MAIRRFLLALFALLLVLPTTAVQAQDFPKLTGRVVDAADLLDPNQEAALTQKLAALEQTTGRQLVVATVPDLQGRDIADYGYQLGRSWGIGQKDEDNGAILIVAPNERRMRIEVGYGLEPILTDALSGRIIRQVITPRFKDGDFPGGINAGVDEIIRIIQLPPEEQQKLAAQASHKGKATAGEVLGAIAIVAFILLIIFISAARAAVRGGRRYRGGVSPIVVWAASEALGAALRGGGHGGGSGWGGGGGGGWGGGGGFSGGGGSFGGGGASGGW